MSELKTRVSTILKALNENIHEREEVLSVALLSALADQNIFLYGPPGTAKSLISRRLAKVFKSENYFEYLMQKFSTPEEVFGPISLTELKKDNYVRKTEAYLPDAEFAFLDEIWKSSPAILNTLLTLINEKTFRNGRELKKVPLKVLISASNETPPSGQGLEALYDRFLTRLHVPPMEDKNNFETLLQSGGSSDEINISEELLIKNEEWEKWKEEIANVKLSSETLNIINDIRVQFEEKNKSEELDIYVSDRRWQKAGTLLKAGAFFCGRDETNIVDSLLLSHCLWTTKDNIDEVIEIVEDAVRNSGFDTGVSLNAIDEEKEELEKEINKEIYHKSDIYETVRLDGNTQYFKCTKKYETYDGYNREEKTITFYILYSNMKSKDEFNPVDENGNELTNIKCTFDNQGICSIKINVQNGYGNRTEWKKINDYKPTILFHKGDKKEVHESLVKFFQDAVLELSAKLANIIEDTELKKEIFLEELDTPFVSSAKIDIAIESVNQQVEDLKLRHKDCERLESLVG